MNRKQRRQFQRTQRRQEKSVPEQKKEGSQENQAYHFQISHHYTVSIHPEKITAYQEEIEWRGWSEEDAQRIKQKELLRFTRMLQAIQSNKKAFHAILEYCVRSEQTSDGMDYMTRKGDGSFENFEDVLLGVADCLHPEDRKWLEDLFEDPQVMDVGIYLEALWKCFVVSSDGWNIQQIEYVCRDCGHHH